MTVTFSLGLAKSGRSDEEGVGGEEERGLGVVGLPPEDLGGGGEGEGAFLDRKGEMLLEDRCCDLVLKLAIVTHRSNSRESAEREREEKGKDGM